MIVEKVPLPEDPTPADAPPAYDSIPNSGPSSARRFSHDEKAPIPGPSTYPPPPSLASSRSPPPSIRSSTPAASSAKGKGASTWFGFGASRTAREVRSTVLSLVRDLVKHSSTEPAPVAVLDSCWEACKTNGLSMSSILHEKSIENHTPLYWAILKRPSEPVDPDQPDLLSSLLRFSAPLSESMASEIRQACLVNSDHALFQRLRSSAAFAPLLGSEEILLGGEVPPDTVIVHDLPGDEGAFAADFEVAMFQRRMRVTQQIHLEFIARGRLWRLSFFVASASNSYNKRAGSWLISIELLENCPPTWLDSRLIIEQPSQRPFTPPPSLIDSPLPSPPIKEGKPKPTISIRLKSGSMQLVSPLSGNDGNGLKKVVVSLDESLMGSSLQFEYVICCFNVVHEADLWVWGSVAVHTSLPQDHYKLDWKRGSPSRKRSVLSVNSPQ
ncbi:hypothetical protein JAAARDRAFT_132722 [Jaapia argillacea MUCL 33604]|uniref:Uncharacterized protein n=1 Tax=Jaapia argillacea MUCL 33604 TaxID=933084 RepID=A0A067Q0X0_9AGAM|nr:hypothetical protein JAAARDRAFT_132722 [Jaapia argillacea MUCL 33604]